MLMLRRAVLSLAVFVVLMPSSQAEVVADLYEATVPVVGQERTERNDAIRKALELVLVKVSGRDVVAQLPNLPELEQELATAARFAQQFRYQNVKKSPTDPVSTDPNAPPVPTQSLWVRFDEKAVNDLLRSQSLPVWGQTRPVTLVWLVVDSQGQRDILTNTSVNTVRDSLELRARERGLPLRLPFYDLTDRAGLNLSDVWGNFDEAILRASQRYQPEAVLVGRLLHASDTLWQARWSLFQEGKRQDWEAQGEGVEPVLNPGIDHTAEALATRFALLAPTGEHDKILLRINGVRNLVQYNKVVKYLRALSVITSVNPSQVGASDAVFEVESQGGRIAVAQAIDLGRILVVDHGSSSSDGNRNSDLTYRLVP